MCYEAPPDSMLSNVAMAMNLDQEQQLQMCSIREYLLSNLDKVMHNRQGIGLQLLSTVQGQYDATFHHQLASSHVQAWHATQKLHQNLQQVQECLSKPAKLIQVPGRLCCSLCFRCPGLRTFWHLSMLFQACRAGQHCSRRAERYSSSGLA